MSFWSYLFVLLFLILWCVGHLMIDMCVLLVGNIDQGKCMHCLITCMQIWKFEVFFFATLHKFEILFLVVLWILNFCCVLVVFCCLCECVVWILLFMSMVHCVQKPFLKKYFTKLKVDSTTTFNKKLSLEMIIGWLKLWAITILYYYFWLQTYYSFCTNVICILMSFHKLCDCDV
jgi:hypothetical protein